MSIKNLSQELKKWLSAKGLVSVDFQEATDLAFDPQDDYRVVYQAEFLPKAPQQARLEVHLTDKGNVGIGFESRQRVANRLGVRNLRDGFVGGFEPSVPQIEELLLILNLVAAGEVIVRATVMPCFGLGRTRTYLTRKHDGARAELRPELNFSAPAASRNGPLTKTLTFEAWRSS
jgi:hypothetical protein